MIGWSCHFRHCCTSYTYFPLFKSRERAAAKRYAVVDNIIQTLNFEDGVAPSTDLRGVPEPSHYGGLVFVKKKKQKDFRSYMTSEGSIRVATVAY